MPLVKAILSEFKGAKIETLTRKINKELANELNEGGFDENENTYFDEEL